MTARDNIEQAKAAIDAIYRNRELALLAKLDALEEIQRHAEKQDAKVRSRDSEGTPVTAREAFEEMAPLIAPLLEAEFDRRDCCILATRCAIEAVRYFGIEAVPVPVKVTLMNATFARHVAEGFAGVDRNQSCETWGDDSWGVGIGMGKPNAPGRWDGHLIAVADDTFGDFSIQQAERPQRNIITGPAVVGPYSPPMWRAVHGESGTVVDYVRLATDEWRAAPDWKDEKRRRPIVGKLIRALRTAQAPNPHRHPADAI